MFIADLSSDGYFAVGDFIRTIGWLEAGHPYQRGSVPDEFLTSLKRHVTEAFQPVVFFGFHKCSLCPEGKQRSGCLNLLIPTPRLLYVAPELVVHYIEDHGYRPPQEFIEAVLACPEQESEEFMRMLRPFERSWGEDFWKRKRNSGQMSRRKS
jgi:hypothetical protein